MDIETKIDEIGLTDIDVRLRKQFENATLHLHNKPAYTLEICLNILRRYPGCLPVRKVLRKAQRCLKTKKPGGLKHLLGCLSNGRSIGFAC